MMGSLRFESLSIVDTTGEITSTTTFKAGLNIIYGESNTGKTWLLESLDYLFGSKKSEFKIEKGYGVAAIRGTLIHKTGAKITLTREIDSNVITIVNDLDCSKNGEYEILSGKRKEEKQYLNDYLMSLIGIDNAPNRKLIANVDKWTSQSFTWRTMLPIYYVNERNVLNEKSIVLSPNKPTSVKSALAVLLQDVSFNELAKDISPEEKKLRNKGVIAFLESKIEEIETKLREYVTIDEFNATEIKNLIATTDRNLYEELVEQSNRLADVIANVLTEIDGSKDSSFQLINRAQELKLLIKRSEELKSIIESKIERHQFIVEGSVAIASHKPNGLCPVCNQQLPEELIEEMIVPSHAEIKNYSTKLIDVNDNLRNLNDELMSVQNEISILNTKINLLTKSLTTQLQPEYQKLQDSIYDYLKDEEEHSYLMSLIDQHDSNLSEIARRKAEVSKLERFDIENYFNSMFWESMTRSLEECLVQCGYPNLNSVKFDKKSFDVIINQKKKDKQGKGYVALINSCVAISLFKVLTESAVHPLGFILIDTPLLGMEDSKFSEAMQRDLSANLYRTFYQYAQIGQIIVVDNKKNIETADLSDLDINLIPFTKTEGEGRYGYLENKTQDDFIDLLSESEDAETEDPSDE